MVHGLQRVLLAAVADEPVAVAPSGGAEVNLAAEEAAGDGVGVGLVADASAAAAVALVCSGVDLAEVAVEAVAVGERAVAGGDAAGADVAVGGAVGKGAVDVAGAAVERVVEEVDLAAVEGHGVAVGAAGLAAADGAVTGDAGLDGALELAGAGAAATVVGIGLRVALAAVERQEVAVAEAALAAVEDAATELAVGRAVVHGAALAADAAVAVVALQVEVFVHLRVAVVVDAVAGLDAARVGVRGAGILAAIEEIGVGVEVARLAGRHDAEAFSAATRAADRVAADAAIAAVERVGVEVEVLVGVAVTVVVGAVAELDPAFVGARVEVVAVRAGAAGADAVAVVVLVVAAGTGVGLWGALAEVDRLVADVEAGDVLAAEAVWAGVAGRAVDAAEGAVEVLEAEVGQTVAVDVGVAGAAEGVVGRHADLRHVGAGALHEPANPAFDGAGAVAGHGAEVAVARRNAVAALAVCCRGAGGGLKGGRVGGHVGRRIDIGRGVGAARIDLIDGRADLRDTELVRGAVSTRGAGGERSRATNIGGRTAGKTEQPKEEETTHGSTRKQRTKTSTLRDNLFRSKQHWC